MRLKLHMNDLLNCKLKEDNLKLVKSYFIYLLKIISYFYSRVTPSHMNCRTIMKLEISGFGVSSQN